jgi:hypothetical protein
MLSIDYNEASSRVVIVYDYAAEIVSRHFENLLIGLCESSDYESLRDFRRFTFHGVGKFNIAVPKVEGVEAYNDLRRRIRNGSVEFRHACLVDSLAGKTFDAKLSQDVHLRVTFQFGSVDRRLGRAALDSAGEWYYVDSASDEPFDFWNPFDSR